MPAHSGNSKHHALRQDNVIIVGGGLLGVATLYELSARGISATLMEARPELALETSFANGGMLTPSMPDPWNSPGVGRHLISSLFDPTSAMKLRLHAIPGLTFWGLKFLRNSLPARHERSTLANYALAAYSTVATQELQKRLDLRYDNNDAGTLKIFETEESMAGPLALANLLKEQGLDFEVLDRNATVAREPQLADIAGRIAGALSFPDDRGGDARKFVLELARKAEERGGKIRTQTVVRRLLRCDEIITGVEMETGETLSGDVVIAAGVRASELARSVGLSLPVKPAKGYSLTLDATQLGNAMPQRAVIDDAMHAAVVPLGRRLRLVGTAEFAGMDASVRPDRIENLFSLFRRMYPRLADRVDRSTEKSWAGFRPMSADGRPFIGAAPQAGLWLNCGHGHLGWTKAVGSARVLADLMTGAEPAIDASPFYWRRP